MIKKGFRHVLMAEAGEGAGGGGAPSGDGGAAGAGQGTGTGSAPVSQAGAGSAGAAGAAAGASAGASGQGTALQTGGQAVAIPEKLQVKKEDGSIDFEASSLKLAEAYGTLEKRIGTGDLPPKTAADYKVTVPDELKEHWQPESDTILQDFRTRAHEKGLTQAQFDFVMGEYFQLAPQLVSGSQQLSADACVADLRSEWKTDEQYKAGVNQAYRAAVAYAGEDAEYIINTYGNDPKLIRMLHRIGGEFGEDTSITPPGGGSATGETIETLLSSEAYRNPKHADHQRVSKQVSDYYAKKAAQQERSGRAPVI